MYVENNTRVSPYSKLSPYSLDELSRHLAVSGFRILKVSRVFASSSYLVLQLKYTVFNPLHKVISEATTPISEYSHAFQASEASVSYS